MIQIPTWSSLSKIQQIKTVRSTYIWLFLVPLAAKALSRIEEVANVTIFNYSFALQMQLPFSWKIFYFSALSFSLANLIVIWRCYSLIKDHRSLSDFLDEGKNEFHLVRYAAEAKMSDDDIGLDISRISRSGFNPNREQELKDAFWKLYRILNLHRTMTRLICTLLYFVGFCLIGIVLLQNLHAVVKFMI